MPLLQIFFIDKLYFFNYKQSFYNNIFLLNNFFLYKLYIYIRENKEKYF